MKTFLVQFRYFTDLRAEECVQTSNEVAALVCAIERNPKNYADWCDNGPGFHILIKPA